jgi:hypothetical protein
MVLHMITDTLPDFGGGVASEGTAPDGVDAEDTLVRCRFPPIIGFTTSSGIQGERVCVCLCRVG